MRYTARTALVSLLLGFSLNALAQDLARSASGSIAFVDVNIVRPDSAGIDEQQTVVVSGQKIITVGPAADISPPAGSQIIEARGGYLLAGLAEMHAHVPLQPGTDEELEDILFLWAANGVTTIRGMNGEPSHLELRDRLARQEVLGPRLFTAGPAFKGIKVKSADEARRLVIEQQAAGYDFIKVHMGISRATYDAVVQTSIAVDIPFAGHVPEQVGLQRALEVGQATIDHLDSYWPTLLREDAMVNDIDYGMLGEPLTPFLDAAKLKPVAEATQEAGVWNVPTLSMAEKFVLPAAADYAEPGLKYMPYRTARGWRMAAIALQKNLDPEAVAVFLKYRKELVKALHDAGAGLLLGSDAPQILNVPGFSIHRELELLVEAGLTPAEALATGTVNPARFLDQEDTFGRIAEGFDADLILTAGNPMEDLTALREPLGVMLRGNWLSRADLQSKLQRIAEKNQKP